MAEQNWKELLPEFKEKTKAFYAGDMSVKDYKGSLVYMEVDAQKGGGQYDPSAYDSRSCDKGSTGISGI